MLSDNHDWGVKVEGGGATDEDDDASPGPLAVEDVRRVLEGTDRKSRNVYALRHRSSFVVRIERRYASSSTLRSRMI